jgi:transcriptional regulator with XRE-family HTH domain
MFEPLPAIVRMERERQGLTQDALSALAGVSRTRIISLEKGEDNITLELLLKITNALGIRELRITGLTVASTAPDHNALVAAAEAIDMARSVITRATEMAEALERVSRPVDAMLAPYLTPPAPRSEPADSPTVASGMKTLARVVGRRRAGGR